MVNRIGDNYYGYYPNMTFNANGNAVNTAPLKSKQITQDSFVNSKPLSTGAKVGIGTAITVAIAVGADYLFSKGKHVKSLLKVFKSSEKTVKETAENVAGTVQNSGTKASTQTVETAVLQPKPAVQEGSSNAAKQAQEKATKEAQEKAVKEAQEKAAKEAQEKAAKEAQEKAAKEAQEKAAKEAQEKAAKETQRLAAKQAEFEKVMDFSKKYVDEHMKELDDLLLDANGRIFESSVVKSKSYSFDELIKPYEGKVDYLYHATTPESKASILKNGFNQRIAPKHGFLDGVGGTYFSTMKDPDYGSSVIKAKFKGKIAEVDTNLLDNIKCGNNIAVTRHLEKSGMSFKEASDYCEAVLREYLKQKIFNKGFQGIIGKGYSYTAGCRYFSALDPKLIQIIE